MMLQPILGRDDEIGVILDLLDDPDTRLVTLLGPGGVGKTRLSLDIARRAEVRFAHGTRFVAFAGVPDAEMVPGTLAHELDIALVPGEDILGQVVQALAPLHLLLVLDNMEHLAAESAACIAALIRGCPRLKLLATSRAALRVTGEVRRDILPLPVPREPDLVPTAAGPAVELFIRQARMVRPDFSPDAKTVEIIAAICRTVDGLPLAIELAAARVGVLPPAAILDRLDQRLDLLARSHRGAAARHSSLRATIAWSYDLLSGSAQSMYRRLSVFIGGFDLDAVTAVDAGTGNATSPAAVLSDLATLVEHHLVLLAGDDDASRYSMLETIREFGLETLAGCGEDTAARDAHAAHYRDLALRLGPQVPRSPWRLVMPVLRAEWANIRQAAAWLASRGRVDDAIAIYAALNPFLKREDHVEHARTACDAWLDDPHLGERARSIALLYSGELASYVGDRETTLSRIGEVTPIFRANGDLEHLAIALIRGFPAPDTAEEFAQSVARCEEGLRIARHLGNPLIASYAFQHLCWANTVQGKLDEACDLARQWADLSRSSGLELSEANALLSLGRCLTERGELAAAEAALTRAASTYRDCQVWLSYKSSLIELGRLCMARSDLGRAREWMERAAALARERGAHGEVAVPLLNLAELSVRKNDPAQAVGYVRELLSICERPLSRGGIAACFDILAQVAARAGDARNAAILLGAGKEIRRQFGYGQDSEFEQATREAVTEIATSALGVDAFRATVEQGASLPIEDAIALAKSWQLPTAAGKSSSAVPDRKGLSERELDVLCLMCDGLGNAAIATSLGISAHTVTVHVSHILVRLDVGSRTAAVAWAIRNGLA